MLAALLCVALACASALAQTSNPYCGANLPAYVPAPAGWTIVQMSMVTRHGARAPANVLPNEDVAWYCSNTDVVELSNPPIADLGLLERNTYISPLNGYSAQLWSGNCTVGQLTALGASQHYQMGQKLRSIYVDQLKLIGEYFNPDDVYIRSLDVWRGQQSAEANLLGLYPFAQRRGEVPAINIMPAPIETMGTTACAEATYLYNGQMQTPQWAQAQAKMAPLYEKLNSVCNTTSNPAWNGAMGIDHFFDALLSRTCQGLALPCSNGVCIDMSDVSAVQSEGNFEYNYLRAAPGYARASVGAFVQEFTAQMAAATQKQPGPKYSFYSADDNTVGGLLAGFGVQDGYWPPFAANLIFETWNNGTGGYYVRVLYNGAVMTLPACGGSSVCPWTTFNAAASELFVTFKECTPTAIDAAKRNPAHPMRRHL